MTRAKASNLKLEAVAAALGLTRDAAAGLLMSGDKPAKNADGLARKMLSYAQRVCEPQVAAFSTVRAAALNGNPEQVEAALRAIGIGSNWALEQALAKPKAKTDTDPLAALLRTLAKVEEDEGRAAADRLVNGILAWSTGESITFDKSTTIRRAPVATNDDNVVGADLQSAG